MFMVTWQGCSVVVASMLLGACSVVTKVFLGTCPVDALGSGLSGIRGSCGVEWLLWYLLCVVASVLWLLGCCTWLLCDRARWLLWCSEWLL